MWIRLGAGPQRTNNSFARIILVHRSSHHTDESAKTEKHTKSDKANEAMWVNIRIQTKKEG